MYREKQVKLLGLNEHTQQMGSSQLVDEVVRMLIAATVCALGELFIATSLSLRM
jgi:hypothetical protein